MPLNDVFPSLHSLTRLAVDETLFDVKFYPYATVNDDQIFAVVGSDNTFVLRPKLDQDPPYEVLRWFRDRDRGAFNSVVWTKHPDTKKPLLCIAGEDPKHIKILDVEAGTALATLSGHGKGINDLAISPLSTSILASGSNDHSIRFWNLENSYEHQPCVALFSGEGHKAPVLAIHFHPNGRWLLSGGIDTAVCLWAVPDLSEFEREEKTAPNPKPKLVYYPHFFSKEVHHNYVDTVCFYGDLIISRASTDPQAGHTNEILIWKIDGFDSDEDPPPEPPVPGAGRQTRSSFPHDQRLRGFQRLLTLSIPHTDRFYHRFGLLHSPGMRPILAMGNQQSRFLFWDLQRLDEGVDPQTVVRSRKPKTKSKLNQALSAENVKRVDEMRRSESVVDGASTTSSADDRSSTVVADREFTLHDRFRPLECHHSTPELAKKPDFATSSIAWSPDGTWMVGVGDHGNMAIFHRDKSVVGSTDSRQEGKPA